MGEVGLLRAFQRTFQAFATEENAKCSLFGDRAFDTIVREELNETQD